MSDQNNQTPILDLRTLETPEDRPKVWLDSGQYPILSGDDIGPVKATRIQRLAEEYEALRSVDSDDEATDELLYVNMRSQVAIMCPDIPPDELAAIPYLKLLQVILFFQRESGIDSLAEKIRGLLDESPPDGAS